MESRCKTCRGTGRLPTLRARAGESIQTNFNSRQSKFPGVSFIPVHVKTRIPREHLMFHHPSAPDLTYTEDTTRFLNNQHAEVLRPMTHHVATETKHFCNSTEQGVQVSPSLAGIDPVSNFKCGFEVSTSTTSLMPKNDYRGVTVTKTGGEVIPNHRNEHFYGKTSAHLTKLKIGCREATLTRGDSVGDKVWCEQKKVVTLTMPGKQNWILNFVDNTAPSCNALPQWEFECCDLSEIFDPPPSWCPEPPSPAEPIDPEIGRKDSNSRNNSDEITSDRSSSEIKDPVAVQPIINMFSVDKRFSAVPTGDEPDVSCRKPEAGRPRPIRSQPEIQAENRLPTMAVSWKSLSSLSNKFSTR
ncbi:unnamed protein product [Notodromas monacha]|uniref:Uncharacterized protein n=1 Tax=Notodromas monacha TaxID=399045 RepID=A0A7R9BZK6_9CRUS|nr:unnamed protein product [Notodromas monacha]CAG0923729.1 unnamed protein product [Notodromas monacha]